MTKYFICFWIVFFTSCKNESETNTQQPGRQEISLTEKSKRQIFMQCFKYDSLKPIYTLTVIQLYNEVFIHPFPVLYEDVLKEMKNPATYFEYNNKLFLVYSGIEKFSSLDDGSLSDLQRKYDSVCQRHGIGQINVSYDPSPLFLKLQGDSLVGVNDPRLRDTFYGRNF